MPETNSLTYRGYAVQDLCGNSNVMDGAPCRPVHPLGKQAMKMFWRMYSWFTGPPDRWPSPTATC